VREGGEATPPIVATPSVRHLAWLARLPPPRIAAGSCAAGPASHRVGACRGVPTCQHVKHRHQRLPKRVEGEAGGVRVGGRVPAPAQHQHAQHSKQHHCGGLGGR
jgi:hypothetical protein